MSGTLASYPPHTVRLFFRTASFFLPEVHYKSYLTWFGVFDRMVGAGIADKIDKKKPISRWHVLSDYIMLLTRLTCSWLPHAFNSDNMVPSFHYVFEKKNHFLVVFPWCFFEPMPGSLHGLLRRNPVAGRGKRVSKGILSMIHQPKYLSPKRSAAHERGTTAFWCVSIFVSEHMG